MAWMLGAPGPLHFLEMKRRKGKGNRKESVSSAKKQKKEKSNLERIKKAKVLSIKTGKSTSFDILQLLEGDIHCNI